MTAYEMIGCDWSSDVCSSDVLNRYFHWHKEVHHEEKALKVGYSEEQFKQIMEIPTNLSNEIGRASCRERV